MKEYKTEYYIAAEDKVVISFESYFTDKTKYNAWRRKAEEIALSEFYNEKIRLAGDLK